MAILKNSLTKYNKGAKANKKIKVISTFNGVGAFSDALNQIGIKSNKLICEIDKNANNTYYANNKYIKKNHTNDINDLLQNIEEGYQCDILAQTPPCQSFSLQGLRQGLESTNGNLFLTAIQLQKKVDANIVIYENVKGLISHDKQTGEYQSLINENYKNTIGHTLHSIETLLLEDDRYNYYWEVLSANEHGGLPQNRSRIFIVGIKKELDNCFIFPEKIDIQFTIKDILEDEVNQNFYYANRANHRLIPTNQVRRKNKIHTIAKYAETMSYESTRRVYAPYVAPCITTNNYAKFMINGRIRTLTPTEAKRIHGFSEKFTLVGSITQQNKQLGNTVSPGVYIRLLISIFSSLKTTNENERV